ncbi:Imm31 family immunity protein [Orbus sturtevantii]|uniref:hypothetical protein n=1 Tax=Orbus sturtevantii TaxID=3074109 RepID=UPI00370DABF0
MTEKLCFYEEVEILPTTMLKQFIGKKGAIVGISEEDGILYGYAVLIHGREEIDCFDAKDVKPTGKRFKREDFY